MAFVRFVHLAACAGIFGVCALCWLLRASAAANPGQNTLQLLVRIAVGIAMVSAVAWLLRVTGEMTGEEWTLGHLAAVRIVLLHSDFGHVWLVRLALAVLVAAWSFGRSPQTSPIMLALSCLLLTSIALTGHAAMNEGWLRLLHAASDAVHLVAAGFWIGGMLALLLLLQEITDPANIWMTVRQFAMPAALASATILLSGVVNTLLIVRNWWGLPASLYGQVLILKLVAVTAMLALAIYNRSLSAKPKEASLRTVVRNTSLELLLSVGILLAVGVLGTLMPPQALAATTKAEAQAHASLKISDAWIRALPGKLPAAGYFVLHNDGPGSVTLTGARSAACGQLMLHSSENDSGMSHMSMMESVPVPANATVRFSPGGFHLMCENPSSAVQPGGRIDVILTFDNGQSLSSAFEVRNIRGKSP